MTQARPASKGKEILRRFIDPGADLSGLTEAKWLELEQPARMKLIAYLDGRYKEYLDSFYESADLCVDRYDSFLRKHNRWRYTAIIGTGLLAALNFMAANKDIQAWRSGAVPISAAVGALLLAVLANLETFGNSTERAQTFRESREFFLDAAQEFDRVWSTSVMALGDSALAYANAVELYRRIVAADRDLRSTFKELSKQGKAN